MTDKRLDSICLLASVSALTFGTLFAQATITSAITADVLCAGTLPSPLATSISATYLDVSDNQLTGLPLEWSTGFVNATESSFVRIYLEQNQIQVCPSSAVHPCVVVNPDVSCPLTSCMHVVYTEVYTGYRLS